MSTQSGPSVVTARVQGDHLVHLVAPTESAALCGGAVRGLPPRKSFRAAGCARCLGLAAEAGYAVARDGDHAWINLGRIQPAAI